MSRLLRDRHHHEQTQRDKVQQRLNQDTHNHHSSTASPGNLRGIPIIAHGVTGAVPGTSPHTALGTAAA